MLNSVTNDDYPTGVSKSIVYKIDYCNPSLKIANQEFALQ